MLSDFIITEAAVGNITSLDNKMSFPVSVAYSTKSGRSGENLTKLFTDHIKICKCVKLVQNW